MTSLIKQAKAQRRPRAKKKALFLYAFVLLSVVLAGCGKKDEGQMGTPSGRENAPTIIKVHAASVKRETLTPALTLTGTLKANRSTIIGPEVSGRIARIYVDTGDVIRKGQKLIELDQEEFVLKVKNAEAELATSRARLERVLAGSRQEEIDRAEAAVMLTRANRDKTELDFNRIKKLLEKGSVARKLYDEEATDYAVAVARLTEAEAFLSMKRKGPTKEEIEVAKADVAEKMVAVDLAKNKQEDAIMTAPYDAVVLRRICEEGAVVNDMPATEIMEIVDISTLKACIGLPERFVSRVAIGLSVPIFIEGVERDIIGKIESISPQSDPTNRTFLVKALVKNDDLKLKAGLFVTAHLPLSRVEDALTIPEQALSFDSNRQLVMVVVDDKIEHRTIEAGVSVEGRVEVRSGVTEDEVVVVDASRLLEAGTSVILDE